MRVMTLEMLCTYQYFCDKWIKVNGSGTKQDVFPRDHSTASKEETPKSFRFFDHVVL
jgi:hypothetical protein